MNGHPAEAELALLAGGDCGWLERLRLRRHISHCGDCQDTVASFSEIRSSLSEMASPAVAGDEANWEQLAGEMRANIRLGLAAGECIGPVRTETPPRPWVPRFAYGMAGVAVLLGAGMFLRGLLPHPDVPISHAAVLESTDKGIQVRTSAGSMTLLNQSDAEPDQYITSQGAVRARCVDGDTGTVTITSVYAE
ncbi:MAG TPA: hypothetical protein VHC90_14485 [Bryobacteraceae bacterium]|nr:hypothetical protein [Bryobacteraceae bacterium]